MWQERPRHAQGQNESAVHRMTKWIRLCLAEVLYDWQVHPDQTKAVKGQNSKTLVTASTIKRPLPCPVQRMENRGIFHDIDKKKQSKKRRKKIRTKIERKGKKTKKEMRELDRKSMHQ